MLPTERQPLGWRDRRYVRGAYLLPLVRCVCACGGTLEAADTLDAKRDAAEAHSVTPQHRAWRERLWP